MWPWERCLGTLAEAGLPPQHSAMAGSEAEGTHGLQQPDSGTTKSHGTPSSSHTPPHGTSGAATQAGSSRQMLLRWDTHSECSGLHFVQVHDLFRVSFFLSYIFVIWSIKTSLGQARSSTRSSRGQLQTEWGSQRHLTSRVHQAPPMT